MKIVAGTPASRAAQATDWPWLPAVAATTPAARSESVSEAILLTAPRILNDPVRCRFSAFSRTLRPVARENVSDGKTGVTFATPSMRSRAARMSASVGPIAVQVEDLLEDLANRGERVELPRLDLVEQAAELRIVGDGLLEMLLRARRRDREHLAREVLAAARLELTLGLEEPAVLGDLLPELVDPLAVHGLGQHAAVAPGAPRPDVGPGVEEGIGEADAVAEQRAVRERAGRVDRDDPDRLLLRPDEPDQRRDQAGLPDAGRPGDTDRVRSARLRVDVPHQLVRERIAILDERDRPGQRAPVARAHGLGQALARPLPPSRHGRKPTGARSRAAPRRRPGALRPAARPRRATRLGVRARRRPRASGRRSGRRRPRGRPA